MKDKAKYLAFLLRHDKLYKYEVGGWRSVNDLIDNHGFTFTELGNIVGNDSKGRFEFSDTRESIRARWGHSVPIEMADETDDVPNLLYHGTAKLSLLRIQTEGIKRMSRQFVHLTNDKALALETGKRHGDPVIISVDAHRMKEDGRKFWRCGDKIWLTTDVEVIYFIKDEDSV